MVASRVVARRQVVGRLRRLRIGSPWVGPNARRSLARLIRDFADAPAADPGSGQVRDGPIQGDGLRQQLLSYDKASDADEILRELDAAVRSDVGEVRRDLHDVSDRVARIEGALTVRVGAVPGGAAAPALPVAAGAGYR